MPGKLETKNKAPDFTPTRKRVKPKFNPDREYIEKALEEYLAAGGTIDRLEKRDTEYPKSFDRVLSEDFDDEDPSYYVPSYIPEGL